MRGARDILSAIGAGLVVAVIVAASTATYHLLTILVVALAVTVLAWVVVSLADKTGRSRHSQPHQPTPAGAKRESAAERMARGVVLDLAGRPSRDEILQTIREARRQGAELRARAWDAERDATSTGALLRDVVEWHGEWPLQINEYAPELAEEYRRRGAGLAQLDSCYSPGDIARELGAALDMLREIYRRLTWPRWLFRIRYIRRHSSWWE